MAPILVFEMNISKVQSIIIQITVSSIEMCFIFYYYSSFEVRKRYAGFLMLSAIVDRPFMFSADVLAELWYFINII